MCPNLEVDIYGNGSIVEDVYPDIIYEDGVGNHAPIADVNGPYTGDEGSPISFDGTASCDPDGTIVSWEWDLDGEYDDAQGEVVEYTWGDNYSGNISLNVTDNLGAVRADTATVTVNNVAPIVDAGPGIEVLAGWPVSFSGNFTDPGWLDTHSATIYWGDGTVEAGTLTEGNMPPDATGTVIGNHIYYDKGEYTVTLTVVDDDGGVGTDTLAINVEPISATIDFDPDTLNLRSKGKWVTVYIELPEGCDVAEIDATLILLNEEVAPVLDLKYGFVTDPESYLMDHDGDGILERMMKFDRAAVQEILSPGGEVTVTITGKVLYNDGLADFEGSDVIKVK